jgi:MFS transporter, Spinster family, sphingosine-1-phosphate transporter
MPIATVIFLTLVNLVNYFDRYIVQAVEPRITAEFSLSNTEAGYVMSAFVLGYFLFSPVFGYLGDRFDRRRVMAIGLVVWSLCTAMTSMATGAISFILCRILVGVGEACYGAIVPVYLKGKVDNSTSLNRALSIFYVAIPVGSALGYIIGGLLAAEYGWRFLFVFAALPGLILSAGFLFLTPDRSHVQSERVHSTESTALLSGVKKIICNRFLVLVILGYVLNTFALNGVAAFVVRHGSSLGLSEAQASSYFGAILVITGLLGTFGGGYLASYFASKSKDSIKTLLGFVAVSTLMAVPLLGACFLASSTVSFLAFCGFAELLIFAGVAPLNSVLVERAPRGFESLTQGVVIFMIQLFGGFLGPVVIGVLADQLDSLGLALQGTTVALLLSGLLWTVALKRSYSVVASRV